MTPNENPGQQPLCVDTKCYTVGLKLTMICMLATTGYGIYGIYEASHKKHGNSSQTYIITVFEGISLICLLLMAVQIIKLAEKSIREHGGVKEWCQEIPKKITYACCFLFCGKTKGGAGAQAALLPNASNA